MKSLSGQAITMHGAYRQVLFHPLLRVQARGSAELLVLNPDQSVDRKLRVQNLILNNGLDDIASGVWCDQFKYCAAGSDNTPTADDSGATTAAQTLTGVTLSGGAFVFTNTATDAGKIIKWDSGQTARIVTITNPTTAVVTTSASVPAGEFTVYRTNQVQLGAEIVRTDNGSYVQLAGSNQTTRVDNVITHKRTYDFPIEVGSVTYREIGFSNSLTPNANLFSRIALPVELPLVANQTLRVVYTLQLTVTPSTPYAKTAPILGWPVAPATDTDGSEQIQLLGFSSIAANGTTTTLDSGLNCNEPSAYGSAVEIFLSTSSAALAAIGNASDRSTGFTVASKATGATAYTPGAQSLDKFCTFDVGEANDTGWRTIGVGAQDGTHEPAVNTGFAFLFDQAQTKDNLHTLELHFTYSWDRDLS